MPIPAILGAAGAIGSATIGAISTGSQNRRSQRWSERMYQRQYNDNVNFWRQQNEYNNPTNQMARLKAAGLNPHLVYGGGSGGTAGTAGPIAKADTPTPNFTPTLGQNANVIGSYMDYEIKKATADNLREQNNAIKSKVALDLANAIFTGSRTKKNDLETKQLKEMFTFSLDALKSNIAKTEVDIQFTRDENKRKQIRLGSDLAEASERILTAKIGQSNARALLQSTQLGNKIKQLDINLKKRGIQPTDNILMRMLGQAIRETKLPKWFNKSLFLGGKSNQ